MNRFRTNLGLLLFGILLSSLQPEVGAAEPRGSKPLRPEMIQQWHQWRGPWACGEAASDASPPLHWNDSLHVQWVADLPGDGTSTPIVWDDQVFVLSAEATQRKSETPPVADATSKTIPPDVFYRFLVTSIDRGTGKVRWQKLATEQVPHEGKHNTHTYAAASPTTDGERLYASFGSRGIFCYSLEGELLWQKDLGDMKTRFGWGEAVNPSIAGDSLIVNWDQEEGSFITALDAKTGEERWRKSRPDEVTSWNTPLITQYNDRTLAIVNGTHRARAYDVENGDVIWECGGQTTNAIPSPLRFDDFVVCMSGYRGAASFAIPLNSTGDLTDSASLLWKHNQGTPYVPSPTISGSRIYFTAQTTDIMTCLDASTGQPISERMRLNGPGNMYASPLAANGYVYFLGRNGTAVVVRDGSSPEIIATNTLSGTFDASPVAIGRQLFLRSWTGLYCLQE
jgi:outer membrane protein assembly factor BamB